MSKGLYNKYTVINNDTGVEVKDAFVLKPKTDYDARKAILFYAQITDNALLAQDINKWINSLTEHEDFKCPFRDCPVYQIQLCCGACNNSEDCMYTCDLVVEDIASSPAECKMGEE